MRQNLLNKSRTGRLAILLVAGILVLSGCDKYRNNSSLCCSHAGKVAGKFAAKKGKKLDLYKAVGVFDYMYAYSHKNAYLHVYFAAKTGAADDFVVELDLKTCKPRFSDKLDTDNPEIVEIANKLMLEKGRNLNRYALPQISDDTNEWLVIYSRLPPMGHDDGLTVLISKKNLKAILLRDLEVPPDNWDK